MKQKTLFFILTGVMVLSLAAGLSCTGKTSVNLTIENAGRWSYQFFDGYQSVPDYEQYSDPEGGFVEAITINTAQINGNDYLLLNFPALSSRHNGRIFIFDTEDPITPEFISSIAPEKQEKHGLQINYVTILGNILYGGVFGDKGLWMVDISNPTNPVDLGVAPLGMIQELVVADGYIYGMSQMNYDLPIAYIADPQNTREITRIDTHSRDCQLAISDHLLFVGLERTLTIYDISVPSSPQQLGTCNLALSDDLTTELPFPEPGEVHWANWANIIDLQVSVNYVYATFGAGGLRVIDVSDPNAPHEVAEVDIGGFAVMLTLKDNLLYMTKSSAEMLKLEMSIIDISQPESPRVLDSVTTESWFGFGGATLSHCFMRPQVVGDYVYVAGMNYLDVYRIH
jgi:hypothetical protein